MATVAASMDIRNAERVLAISIALIGWVALFAQLMASIGNAPEDRITIATAVWRYFGFLTILGNYAVVMVATHAAFRPNHRQGLGDPRFEMATAVTVIIVGAVYGVMLNGIYHYRGIQIWLSLVFHDLIPILFVLFWLIRRTGKLSWRAAFWGAVPMTTYGAYSLARGSLDGWYPYPFFNPVTLTIFIFARNSIVLLVIAIALSLMAVALDQGVLRAPKY
jgi:hypothetical protein